MSLSGEDSNGNKLNAEMEEELHELRTEKKILEFLEPMRKTLNEVKAKVDLTHEKVEIHNNYEGRLRKLERNQYVFASITFLIGAFTGTVGVFFYKLITKL